MRNYKRVYKLYSSGLELIGYKAEDVTIEIYFYEVNAYGKIHKDYIVPKLKELNYPSRFETLKEAKEYIEKYL